MLRTIRTGLWWVFAVIVAVCLLASLVVGRTTFTMWLLVIAAVAWALASLLELAGGRR